MQAMAAKTMLAEINSLADRLFISAPCQRPLRAGRDRARSRRRDRSTCRPWRGAHRLVIDPPRHCRIVLQIGDGQQNEKPRGWKTTLAACAFLGIATESGAQSSEAKMNGAGFLSACSRPGPEWIGFCHGYVQATAHDGRQRIFARLRAPRGQRLLAP
jgi:hypothetical protein